MRVLPERARSQRLGFRPRSLARRAERTSISAAPRHFKFVDRTFNLKTDDAQRLLQFFLDRLPSPGETLFAHFEVVPDRLPERLKQMIVRFPAGVLQFEVGVQSFNADIQRRISRRQDNERSEANLRWLLAQTKVHVHADLIFRPARGDA